MSEDKKQVRSQEVFYASGEVVRIRAVPPSKMDDLIELQRSLLSMFLYYNALPGELLRKSNSRVWEDLHKIGAMIPLVGPAGSFLEVDKIDDSDEICRIFFTSTSNIDPDTGAIHPGDTEAYEPSVISILHGINFWERLYEGRRQAISRMKAEQALQQTETEEENPITPELPETLTSLPAESPTLTPLPT